MTAPLDGATPCLPLESFANSRLYRPSCHAFGHPLLEGWQRTGAVLRFSELDDPSLAPLRPLLSPHRVGSTVADGWHRCGWVAPLRVGGTVAGGWHRCGWLARLRVGGTVMDGWHRCGWVAPLRVGGTVADGWHRCGWVAPLRMGGPVADGWHRCGWVAPLRVIRAGRALEQNGNPEGSFSI